jgi:hypothetical protein
MVGSMAKTDSKGVIKLKDDKLEIINALFTKLLEDLKNRIYFEKECNIFDDEFGNRLDDFRSMRNKRYFPCDINMMYNFENENILIFVSVSQNPAYLNEVRIHYGKDKRNENCFSVQKIIGQAGKDENEFKDFYHHEYNGLLLYIEKFLEYKEETP